MSGFEPSAQFLERFRATAGPADRLPFDRFMEVALYDPQVGYYRSNRPRVGQGPGTDFFTSSSSAAAFGELVVAASVSLLGERAAGDHRFVEIGAEPGGGVLAGVTHPFRTAECISVGKPIELAGRCVVFSNELFDAQPFRRFRVRSGAWRELGVEFRENSLFEIEFQPDRELPLLPTPSVDGRVFDAPVGATALARRIAEQPWSGLFVALDYGDSADALTEAYPAGTARAYRRHAQSRDLLAQPGEQDLTCDVCWDWIRDELMRHRFSTPALESQEAFFVNHSAAHLARIAASTDNSLGGPKRSILQLLHPGHLGQRFQALWAIRDA